MPIRVVNRKHYNGRGIYIGRATDPADAVFGNPYTHLKLANTLAMYQVATREEAIRRYKEEWIPKQWEENEFFRLAVKELVRRYLSNENVVLVCHCKEPDREVACHGDALKELVEQLAEFGALTLNGGDDGGQ